MVDIEIIVTNVEIAHMNIHVLTKDLLKVMGWFSQMKYYATANPGLEVPMIPRFRFMRMRVVSHINGTTNLFVDYFNDDLIDDFESALPRAKTWLKMWTR